MYTQTHTKVDLDFTDSKEKLQDLSHPPAQDQDIASRSQPSACTCIRTYIHICNCGAWTPNEGFMQSLLRTRFAIINLQSVLCTLQHCHSNKLSHRLSLRMKFGTGTLDPINHDTHTHTHTHTHLKYKHGFGINHIGVHVNMCI